MGIMLLIGFLFCVCLNIFIPDDNPKEIHRKNYLQEQERKKKKLINWAYQNNQKIEITYKKFNGDITKNTILSFLLVTISSASTQIFHLKL